MSRKQQPIPFTRQVFKPQTHIHPLELLPKSSPFPATSTPTPSSKQLPPQKPHLLIPRDKPISKSQTHTSYRTKMCPQGRDCRIRSRCKFAHTAQELRRPFYKRTKPCMLYQKGLCSLGSACREYHGNFDLKGFDQKNYKTKLCEDYEKGECTMGKICVKAHGEEELQYYLEESRKMQDRPEPVKQNQKQEPIVLKLVPFEGKKKGYLLQEFHCQEQPEQNFQEHNLQEQVPQQPTSKQQRQQINNESNPQPAVEDVGQISLKISAENKE